MHKTLIYNDIISTCFYSTCVFSDQPDLNGLSNKLISLLIFEIKSQINILNPVDPSRSLNVFKLFFTWVATVSSDVPSCSAISL